MSSSLDKLKALNNKLEDKLAQKRGTTNEIPSNTDNKQAAELTAQMETKAPLSSPAPSSPIAAAPEQQPTIDKIEEVLPPPAPVMPKKQAVENLDDENNRIQSKNKERVYHLYQDLGIQEKVTDFESLFLFKAMNLSGVGLREEDFAEVRSGKYIQIIAINYEPDDSTGKKRAKNISLGYYGKGETIDPILKNKIIEFILRWRYEKAFQNMEHYRELLDKIKRPESLF